MAAATKLTKATSDRIKAALERGAYLETAAAHAGIARSTFYDWLKRGRTEAGDYTADSYGEFVLMVDQALAQSELADLKTIEKAADEIWQAAAWRLERRWPEKYGRRTAVALDSESGPIVVKLAFDPDA
jgi:transposase